jgi:hypothetical protein
MAVATRAATRETALARQNAWTEQLNQRIALVLSSTTGQQLPASPELWWQWWDQHNDVQQQGEKQVRLLQQGTQLALADRVALGGQGGGGGGQVECFAAGTLVWTAFGVARIEAVRVGDLVLAQDVQSGELAYKPVLRTTVRPAEPLMTVQIGEETFRTTAGHLFWVSGEGWVRVRDLESGMQVHGVGGAVPLFEIEDKTAAAETYNLRVADFNTYFVGKQRVLSHDVTDLQPTNVAVPGLPDD